VPIKQLVVFHFSLVEGCNLGCFALLREKEKALGHPVSSSIMRLLDTKTLECKEFWASDIPPYAILSHTWSHNSDDEVTLHDLRAGHADKKAGFAKLEKFCELAKQHSLAYAWMDTCCIDKSSSAELSEAINSMFKWYEMSTICYAYLEDMHDDDVPVEDNPSFRNSRWFTRGWTLQELIAPAYMVFYSVGWKPLGYKVDRGRFGRELEKIAPKPPPAARDICVALSTITEIDLAVLKKKRSSQVVALQCAYHGQHLDKQIGQKIYPTA
jgi:hypothetical protein